MEQRVKQLEADVNQVKTDFRDALAETNSTVMLIYGNLKNLGKVVREFRSHVEHRLSEVDDRLDSIDDRLDTLDKHVDGMDKKIDALGGKLDHIISLVTPKQP